MRNAPEKLRLVKKLATLTKADVTRVWWDFVYY
jgi:hypothetical protein